MSKNGNNLEKRSGQRRRPDFARGYGVNLDAEGMLSLDWVREQLATSRNYWIVSTRPDGRPHASPVWGIWLDDVLCFGTSRRSRKGRNISHSPHIVAHVESGDDVVILEGVLQELTDHTMRQRYVDAYDAKYAIRPEADDSEDPDGVTYLLRPEQILAWKERDFLTTPTRWRFALD